MAYDVTLSQLVDDVRAEIGASTNPGQGINQLPTIQRFLRRTQSRLYLDFAWPHLFANVDESLVAGERYYTFNPTVNFDRIVGASISYGGQWTPVIYGITDLQYNVMNSDNNVRSAPVTNWRHYDRTQYEVWPIPSASNQTIRFQCMLNLRPLLANNDVCDLDSDLLVLFVAAQLLKNSKSAGASDMLSQAMTHYKNLRANQLKVTNFINGGGYTATSPHPLTNQWTLRAPILP